MCHPEKIETGQKRLEKNWTTLLTFIKKQEKENFVTIDLNSSSFVIDPNASFQQPLTNSDSQVPVVTCVTSVASAATDIVPKTIIKELEERSKQYDKLEETVNTELTELTPTVCELVLQERKENEKIFPEVQKTTQPVIF